MTKHGANETSPLFTVIIPNKNRARFLHHTLRTCAMQNYERLEVIVSDDASTENTRDVVEDAARRDPRIRSVFHESPIGMRENFEFALRQAKSGFVIALGGDDGLLPDGIQGMRDLLRETSTELLAWSAPIYTYPGVRGTNGQLAIYRTRGTKLIESKEFLARQAKNLHYLSDIESPMCYVKGVASTTLIDRVRRRSADGRFYACPTPDGYSGIVLAGEVTRYAFSGKPFTIFGASPESQGLAYMLNDAEAKKSSESFIRSVASRPMHEELASQPYSPLITLMTVDYLLTCRDLPGWPGAVPPIDYRAVLSRGLDELAHGMYGDERLCRELGILLRIAQKHGLERFFQEKVRRSRRHRERGPFEGTGINVSAFFLDASAYELRNIVDAAYAAKYVYQAYADLQPASMIDIVSRSISYRLRAMAKGKPFPAESEWIA